MDKIQVEIIGNEIKFYDENQIHGLDENVWPDLRGMYDDGLYEAFIDRACDPFKITHMTKITSE